MARDTTGGGSRNKKPSIGQRRTANDIAKANARKSLTSVKGIAGLIGGAVLEGIGGPKARGAKVVTRAGRGIVRRIASEAETTGRGVQVNSRGGRVYSRATTPTRAVRNPVPNKKRPLPKVMNRTTTGQGRKKISDKVATAVAREAAGPKAGAPFGRNQKPAKPAVGRILSKSERNRDAYYKSKQNPVKVTQGKPKPKTIKSQAQKDLERRLEIRKAISGKPGKRAPKALAQPDKPKRTMSEIIDPLKGKYVVTGNVSGRPIKMDAQEYILTRARFKSAGENPENSVAPRTRIQDKARSDAAEKRAALEARREEILARVREMRDTSASKANPKRYSSPEQEYGNVRQTEGLVAQGEKRIQQETTRRRVEQEKIANTARAKKQVEATLQRQKNREAILAETRKKSTITRRPNNPGPVKPGRTRRAK